MAARPGWSDGATSQGIHHSYACLALLEITSRSITVQDLRQTFRPLTTDYLPKTGGAIGGSLAIEGSLNVGGSVTADSFIGPLGPGAVGTEQLVDHAVTGEKLDSAIGTVPSGFAILGDTATAPPGYAYTGSVMVSVNLQPSCQKVAEIPSQIAGHMFNGASGGTIASVAVKGRVYVFLAGGELVEYDPASGQWAVKSSLPGVRRDFAVVAWNDRIYVMGGSDEVGAKTGLNEEYNPVTNTWQARAAMSTPRSNLAAAALEGRIYATGGIDSSGKETCVHEAYQPETDTWDRMADMPTARSDLAMGVANGKLYAIGGEKSKFLGIFGEAITGENEEYSPAENRWSSRRAHMPTPRRGLTVAGVNNSLYAIGGLGRDGLAALAAIRPLL
jgi:N-acetylneuraminic acid mutarotase